jgi:hypothetical protein
MELILNESLELKITNASSILGFRKQDIIQKALVFYLDSINSQLELKNEFNNWDILSDEALTFFENAL